MKYNFDEVVNRVNTDSLKWDGIEERLGVKEKGLLPMWVADMDFKTPQPIRDAIHKKIEHGILGYAGGYDQYYQAIVRWMKKKHQWDIQKEWIVFGGNVVSTLSRIIRTFTNPGDKIMIQSPVFATFFYVIQDNGRQVVNNPLKFNGETYEMDFDDLEKKLDEEVKLMILCSPHNPVGRVWNQEELIRLGELCIKNNTIIVSDEIHAEIVFSGNKHTSFATISETFSENSIICTSPHKAFNMAGLEISNTIIPNNQLRESFKRVLACDGINKPNLLGIAALQAAYTECEEWLNQMVGYCEENYQFLCKYLKENIPEVQAIKMEGTYLVWLNFNGLNLDNHILAEGLIKDGKLLLSQGHSFGEGGDGFVRMNIACPKATLQEALYRLNRTLIPTKGS
ncbi:MalY/PatB family protein [Alkaliphilus peptidifermentans]|uniref:cysteine-S-conjugate beta-lyase n=1 Tax=Alkaliphilus peptidifermentans DSM 18978 TaxID=1120976 RepID=A0A1G5IAP5_9FIRM|nr:MalY/PatB family protein [Alkaliphilus peptidifermentans]SCY73047.1 cystathione beta-lyase [Alkaliphilus peptidifermentans DSM 18978]